ncbi:hypothetical protein ACFOON_02890 [Novosphingobium piscinae]|uniref:hypothetical protein n=1 Tax=Novosphingobium piscinae TaxID=1507448 RepID=UPI001FE90B19|nr:hypothetical protein [Novosphingobium piscinae]
MVQSLSPGTAPAPSPAPHLKAAADILSELAVQVEALGARLCADPDVVTRHITELQAIDLIAQKQLHLAELLTADCPRAAVEAMRIEEVKRRIGMALPGQPD